MVVVSPEVHYMESHKTSRLDLVVNRISLKQFHTMLNWQWYMIEVKRQQNNSIFENDILTNSIVWRRWIHFWHATLYYYFSIFSSFEYPQTYNSWLIVFYTVQFFSRTETSNYTLLSILHFLPNFTWHLIIFSSLSLPCIKHSLEVQWFPTNGLVCKYYFPYSCWWFFIIPFHKGLCQPNHDVYPLLSCWRNQFPCNYHFCHSIQFKTSHD